MGRMQTSTRIWRCMGMFGFKSTCQSQTQSEQMGLCLCICHQRPLHDQRIVFSIINNAEETTEVSHSSRVTKGHPFLARNVTEHDEGI